MSLDTILAIPFLIGSVVSYIGYRHLSENSRITYKEQILPYNGKEKKK